MVEQIQRLASGIVLMVRWYHIWWDSFFNWHSYTYNYRASALPL